MTEGGPTRRFDARELVRDPIAVWLVAVGLGLTLAAVAVELHWRLGTAAAPFTAQYRGKLEVGSLLAPAVALIVLRLTLRRPVTIPWRRLLVAGYLVAVAWTFGLAAVDGGNGFARPVVNPDEYLIDVGGVGNHPGSWLAHFVASSDLHSAATRTHPPAPVLFLWLLGKMGITRPGTLGFVLAGIGCLTIPLVAIAVRSLCGETAARRLLPVLALAPYAVWVAVSMDAVTMTLAAAGITCGVLASEHRRTGWSQTSWGLAAGMLIGTSSLFSYAAPWLAISVICVYFVRRRPLLNIITGLGALVPLFLFRAAGYVWTDGLTAAQKDFSLRVGSHRSWLLWAFLDVVILLIACGPALIITLKRLRLTPGWPFLAGAGAAVIFAIGSGLARGEVERSWLPFYPWLLTAAVAPLVRPTRDTPPTETAGPMPWPEIVVGVIAATVLQAILRTTW